MTKASSTSGITSNWLTQQANKLYYQHEPKNRRNWQMTLPYIMSKDAITVMANGNSITVREGQLNYAALREAIRNREWEAVPQLLSPAKAVEAFADGRVTVANGEVMLDGASVHNAVSERILHMVEEGFDAQPLMRFLENLMRNPSKTAIDELYLWLEGTSLPITEDGCFMAYKKVRSDYMDFYTGKVLNKPALLLTEEDLEYIKKPQGNVVVTVQDGVTTLNMPRGAVDDRRHNLCSTGLHFCSLSYLPCYHGGQGRVLLVKINPADVVSIPSDYNNAKGRAMSYQILGEHKEGEHKEGYTTSVVTSVGAPVRNSDDRKQAAEDTWVLGVNFGNTARAAVVRAMMHSADGAQQADGAQGRTMEQARVDGFDDAWNNQGINLARSAGCNMREVVEYAQAYFEGYDRCRGHAPQVQAHVPEPTTVADQFDPINAQQRDEIMRVMCMPVYEHSNLHGARSGADHGKSDGADDRVDGNDYDLRAVEGAGTNYRNAYVKAYTQAYNQH
jgi:hypothetical protein